MKCLFCNFEESAVIETRIKKDGEVRRRRECLQCKNRFSTIETVIKTYPLVIKKDKRREDFSKEKLKKGIELACFKRPVSQASIDQVVHLISHWVLDRNEKEVNSEAIGEKMMIALKDLDHVAYIRFASVYKQFKDVDEFVKSIKEERRGNHEHA